MKEAQALKILKHVQDSYNLIAYEFSESRFKQWDEFKFYQPYLFEGAEIIDLGCGNGRILDFLYQHYLSNNFKYIGLDNSEGLLKEAHKKHPNNVFLPGDQLEIPIDDNQADILLNIAAFHHIPSPNLRLQALLEMNRILKPGGLLIISVWNLFQKKYWLAHLKAWLRFIYTLGSYSPTDLFITFKNSARKILANRYYHSFFPDELNSLVKKAGFTIRENYSIKKGNKVPFFDSFNYCIVAQKSK